MPRPVTAPASSPRLLDSAARVAASVEGPTTNIHFCGLGGTTDGALRARLRPIVAVNHSAKVIEVHARNFPAVWADCADLSQTDPERYAPSEIYQASPSCTRHSAAAGARRKQRRKQLELFQQRQKPILEAGDGAERSRATMFCVLEHAEVAQPAICLVENVNDAVMWQHFDLFLEGMRRIGYRRQRLLSINAAFVGGTPQDRDRMHMVFTHDDAVEPDLALTPPAPCPTCREDVLAVQHWKHPARGFAGTPHRVGEYGAQYLYACPQCATPVVPYFRSALNAIDFSVEAPTLAALGPKLSATMRLRIQKGLERFGPVPMLLINNCTTHNGRVRSLLDVAFTQTGTNSNSILLPPMDAGLGALPDPTWVDARHPRLATGLRGAVRSHSALIDDDRVDDARRLFAGARAHATDLGAWRLRTLTPTERLVLQGFRPTHHVEGSYKEVHLMIGNANPPTVEAELAARAGAALRPDAYPADLRPNARSGSRPGTRRAPRAGRDVA